MNILIVDDLGSNRVVLREVLESGGFSVVEAEDGGQALKELRAGVVDLVISDIQMPQMDGYRLTQKIRADARLSHLPIILYTSTYYSAAEENLVLACGADRYLKKPSLPQVLLDTIRCLTDKDYRAGLLMRLDEKKREFRAQAQLLKDSEEQREQLQHFQKINDLGRLAGGIAHDFNNILMAVLGYSEVLAEACGRDNAMKRDVGEIQHAVERGMSLTRQLLAFSRKQVLETRVLELNALIFNIQKMLKRLIGDDIVVTVAYSDLPLHFRADHGQVEQVITNLAENARDAMPQGGRLEFEAVRNLLDEAFCASHPGAHPGRYVRLTVRDTGFGIAPDVRARIFEPYYTTKASGTGLGLATAYGIVAQSGGFISVESEVGKSTTFRAYFPEVEAEPSKTGPAGAPAAVTASSLIPSETILLVEDERPLRELLSRTLKEREYKVLEAVNGEEALRLCREYKGPIQLLLTDEVMPGMRGTEVAGRACLLRPALRVLVMSGYMDVGPEALAPGMVFIAKPCRPSVLANKVREVLDVVRPDR